MNVTRTFMPLLLICLLFCCTGITVTGGEGNGSETIARGVVVDSTGLPAADIPVRLLPAAYDPVASDTLPVLWSTVTDDNGEYRLESITAGTYTLEAGSSTAGVKALVKSIVINGERVDAVVDTGRLEKTGTIVVELGELAFKNGDYVYLPGTSTFTIITDLDRATGQVFLNGVPVGTYTDLMYVAADDSHTANILKDTLAVNPGETVPSAYTAWKYSKSLLLNTTASGADITGTVYNFPVLVRLSGATFDFSQAQNRGNDIRFTTSDGSSLACEIERWDPVAEIAEVWVKVDTIHDNDSTQTLIMYWGNPDALAIANGAAVFDTAAGFRSVWHLGENGGTIADATTNRFNGVGKGDQTRSTGEIGYGQTYDGSGDYTEMGDVDIVGDSGFTISAWVKMSTTEGYRTIISKTNGGVPSPSYGWLVEFNPDGQLIVFMATDSGEWGGTQTFVLASTVTVTDTVTWHHITVVIDRYNNDNCRLYIDGTDVSDVPVVGDITTVGYISNALPLRIGSEADGEWQWDGEIDECIISHVARSDAWVRLCYRNQGTVDRLVKFR